MTMITPSYLGETIEYSSLHACRSTLEDPTFLLLFLSRFQQFFELAIFAEWLFYMLTATTVFIYRRRRPEVDRPYKVWGYPVLPTIFIVCAGVVLVESYASNLSGSLLGTALILLGLPVLWWVRRLYGASTPQEDSATLR